MRLDLLRLLFRAYFRAGDREGFDQLLESGAFAELTADPQRLLESAAEFAHLLYNWGRIEEMVSLLEAPPAPRSTRVTTISRRAPQGLLLDAGAPGRARARPDRFKDRIEPDSPVSGWPGAPRVVGAVDW